VTTRKNSRSGIHWYAWDPFEWLVETGHLTPTAEAALRRILDHIFRTDRETCSVVDDDQFLAAIAKVSAEEWPDVRRQLIDGAQPLLIKRDGFLQHRRLTEEIKRAAQKSATAQRNGAARGVKPTEPQRRMRRSRVREQRHTVSAAVAKLPTSSRKATRQQQLSASSANAAGTLDDSSAEGDESQNEMKTTANEIEITTTVVAADPIGFVLNVVNAVVPHLAVHRDHVSTWLTEFPDAGWIAAVVCESELSLPAARHASYILGILREKARNSTTCDDPLGYVRFRLNSLRRKRTAA
jgi:uncharacterized protein YdaU (DUF1376 family)